MKIESTKKGAKQATPKARKANALRVRTAIRAGTRIGGTVPPIGTGGKL